MLNTPAIFDAEPSHSEISESHIQDFIDSHPTNSITDLSDSPSTATDNRVDDSNHIIEVKIHMEEVLKQLDDQSLSTAAANFLNRVEELNLI